MKYSEKHRDLFTVGADYYIAHCISGDFTLGAGVAKRVNELYNMQFKLHMGYPLEDDDPANTYLGHALLIDNVFNLVTKGVYKEKASYEYLHDALLDMKEQCLIEGIQKLAMPKIGCGRDKLSWIDVSDMIHEVFKDTDVEILVCVQ